jgi:quercetin dioxygenase-like cupin family protein
MNENGTGGVVHVEEIRLGGIVLRFLIDGPSSGAPLSMFEMTVATQARVPAPHHHVGFEEVVYGMEGKLRLMRDEEIKDLGPGETQFVPRGVVHGFENPFAEAAKALVVITPGVFGAQYFRDMAALLAGGGPPDPQAIGAVMLKHGLVPVKPT